MPAYYNEIDPYAAAWLRELIKGGHIAPGDVDERDIRVVCADDLRGYNQCHFFAGIGGWSHALRLADWPDTRPVWTGSCPCQPFSTAGARKSVADDRHLWPHWFRLIRERKPPTLFGEQVANAVGDQWLDAVAHDMEMEGYAAGAAVLPAYAVGAPHVRERLWFVAYAHAESEHALPVHAEVASAQAASSNSYRKGLAIGQSLASDHGTERAASIGGDWWLSEPAVGRVADGVPARMGKLRALGNAIVPQVAAEFIAAFLEVQPQ